MAIATGSSPVGAQEMKGFCRNGLVFAERGWRHMAFPQTFCDFKMDRLWAAKNNQSIFKEILKK